MELNESALQMLHTGHSDYLDEYVTPDAPTKCAHTQEPMTWNGNRWVHQPGVCDNKDHS